MAKYDGNVQDYRALLEKGYEFDLSAYLKRGWDLLKENIAGFIAYVFIFFITSIIINLISSMLGFGNTFLTFIMGQLTNIPVIGLSAGFLIVAHKIAKNKPYEFGNFFDGLKDMIQLWLGSFVAGLLAMIPVFIGLYTAVGNEIFTFYETIQDSQYMMSNFEDFFTSLTPYAIKIASYGGVGLLISILVSILYSFTQPLILFERLTFWDAMESSRKIISQKLFSFLLLWLVLIVSFAAIISIPVLLAAALDLKVLMLIAGLIMVAGMIMYFPFVQCVTYATFEGVVLNNVEGSAMDDIIDEIGND